ncbi:MULTISPECIES: O-antigen polymerase [Flavobacterium]|uniref:Oligosaccharide repeat unit polymerase n=1 Tax=Flavobacterium hankyongi TaxID=1176532 RepID=A0ABP9A257_9FLAO|nr:O-antigen polymerase [Flavobacterium sp. N1846]
MLHFFFILGILLILIIRKDFSNYFLSPTGILGITWGVCVILQFVFAPEYYFTSTTAQLFFIFIFSFFLGDITGSYLESLSSKKVNFGTDYKIYQSLTFKSKFTFFLIILGVLSFVGAILYFGYFVSFFGSFEAGVTAGWAARGALEEISVPIAVRAILMLGYSDVVLTTIYFLLYRKIKWFLFLPYISLLIMGIAQAGRAGFILILVQVFLSSFWITVYDQKLNYKGNNNFFAEKKLIKKMMVLIVFAFIIFIGGDMLRRQQFSLTPENLETSTTVFKEYLFGGISAFSTYFENEYSNFSTLGLGKYSYSSLYDLLGISKNEIGVYTKYLGFSKKDSSLTTNIFTAFRQFIDDFSLLGGLFVFFLYGIFSGYFYGKAVKGSLAAIAIMIVVYTYLFHTILLSITVHNAVLISFLVPAVIINICKKTAK